jgi:hypothetical protein
MSALAALLNLRGAPADGDLLFGTTAAQRFRGPDGEGRWQSPAWVSAIPYIKATLEAEREVQPANLCRAELGALLPALRGLVKAK